MFKKTKFVLWGALFFSPKTGENRAETRSNKTASSATLPYRFYDFFLALLCKACKKSTRAIPDLERPVEFKPADSIVSEDPRTGDVIIYANGAAASFVWGRWKPGDLFDPGITKDFDAVTDLDKVQRYLDAARKALLESLKV